MSRHPIARYCSKAFFQRFFGSVEHDGFWVEGIWIVRAAGLLDGDVQVPEGSTPRGPEYAARRAARSGQHNQALVDELWLCSSDRRLLGIDITLAINGPPLQAPRFALERWRRVLPELSVWISAVLFTVYEHMDGRSSIVAAYINVCREMTLGNVTSLASGR